MGHEEHHPFTWLSTLLPGLPEHSVAATLVTAALVLFALRLRGRFADLETAVQPEDGVTGRNVAEVLVSAVGGVAEGSIGHHAERFVPLLAAFFVYILACNLLGLVPGFTPATSNFNTTFALGVVSFVAYNVYGFRANGIGYLKHFMGPMAALAVLMVPIEVFSHCFRAVSLGIRLFANMFADHTVIETFTDLWPHAVVPVAFYVFGTLVCVVQAFVFTLLSAIYIGGAVSHDH
jgi:F-type H+-transporting ATPase subunit a